MRDLKFVVVGLRPAWGKDANEFIKSLDMGEGIFVRDMSLVTVTFKDAPDKEHVLRTEDNLVKAYEHVGWQNVVARFAE